MRTLLFVLSLFLPASAAAVTLENAGFWQSPAIAQMWVRICSTLPFCGTGLDAPRLIGCKIARFIFGSITGVAVCVVLYASIQMITSQGEDGTMEEAKKTMIYAGGGVILAMLAWTVVPFVSNVVTQATGGISNAVVPLTCNF